MEKNIGNDLFRFSVYKNRKDVLFFMIFKKGFDFFSNPDRVVCSCRTNDYQIIGICKRLIYVIIKVTRDGKFFLISEDPLESLYSRLLNNSFGNTESFKACLYFRCDLTVNLGMSVRNKSIIFETHIQLLFHKNAYLLNYTIFQIPLIFRKN